MLAVGGDRDRLSPGAELHRGDRGGRLVVADLLPVTVAELSAGAQAPAPHPAIVENRAGMEVATGDRHRLSSPAELHGSDRGGRLVVADVPLVPVAELALPAFAPAAHLAVVEDRAGVTAAARDRHRRSSRAEVDRPNRARRLVVADVPPVAVAEPAAVAARPSSAPCRCRGSRRCARPPPVIATAVRPAPRSTGPTEPGVSLSPIACRRCRSRAGRSRCYPSSAPGPGRGSRRRDRSRRRWRAPFCPAPRSTGPTEAGVSSSPTSFVLP